MLTTNVFRAFTEAKAYFRVLGSFGELSGKVLAEENCLKAGTNGLEMTCEYEADSYGVIFRKDVICNRSEKELSLSSMKSRFVFDGGEYEVYTQFNTWQKESMGGWQPLVTGVTASCATPASTWNAVPMIVLWSNQQNRGAVIHLLPNCAWEMKVTRIGTGAGFTKVLVEVGPQEYNLNLVLAPGESVKLPEVLCYETKNRLDFDCWKLHNYMHVHYPRKEMPFLYNTWMYRYTDFTVEQLMEQATLAAEMGLEYFVIDAGWFGKGGNWHSHVGDWEENKTGGLFGRMRELSDYVHGLGMKFGIWVEPERAGMESDIVLEKPEEFIKEGDNYFLDFSNPKAYERMMNTICGLIEEYHVEFFKFDFNACMYYDVQHTSFLTYFKYHTKFMNELRERYPYLYLCGCAGGGEKMELADYIKYDSFWPSDNESPRSEMRMFKETILRLPPQGFEKWTCIHTMDQYMEHYKPFCEYGDNEKIIACGDAWWRDLHSVNRNFLKAYHTASPVGFSCDLKEISPELREHFKNVFEQFKMEREFWKNAVVRILTDTQTVTVYQYSDVECRKNVIEIVTGEQLNQTICVYPDLSADKSYCVNGEEIISGKKLMEEGIHAELPVWNDMVEIVIEEMEEKRM